jgi:hypothetical protein
MNLKDVLADHDEEQHINRSARLKKCQKNSERASTDD